MDRQKIKAKFGSPKYRVDPETFVMGIHHLLGSHMAEFFEGRNIVLDTCCGAGFMVIPLARVVQKVIAVDIDPKHLAQAKYNVAIAGLADKVDLIAGNILDPKVWAKIPKIDAAFLDPDWAKPNEDKHVHTPKLSLMQPDGRKLWECVARRTKNIAYRFPREIDRKELLNLPPHQFESLYLDDDWKFCCAYFGKLKRSIGDSDFREYSKK